MTSEHTEIKILAIIGACLWCIGHHMVEIILRVMGKENLIADLSEFNNLQDKTKSGLSDFKVRGFSALVCSAQGAMESFLATAGMFLLVWASVLNGRRAHDAMQLPESDNDYTGTELDIWSAMAPLGIWAGWWIPKTYGGVFSTETHIASAFQAAVQAVSWAAWGLVSGLEKDSQARNFCYITSGVLAMLEVVINHTSMKKAELLNYTIARTVAIMGYIACWSLFVIGFCEDP